MTSEEGQAWHKEPTRHELGVLVMEGETPVALVPREARADQIIRDHAAARDRETLAAERDSLRLELEADNKAWRQSTLETAIKQAEEVEALAARVRELEAAMFDIERILNRRNAAYAKYAHAITLKQLGKVALLSQGAAGKATSVEPDA